MKKILSIALLALMVLALPIALVGCNKKSNNSKNDDSKLIGTWVYSYSESIYNDWQEEVNESYVDSSYTFNKDKTASFSYPLNPEKNDENITWETKGDKIILKYKDDKENTFDLKGNYLIELDYHDGEVIEKHYYEQK